MGKNRIAEALKNGEEAYRRLEAAGFLVLHGLHGERYSLTDSGKARASSLIGHPLVTPAGQLPNLVAAIEKWLLRHDGEESDDRHLVMVAATIMQENGFIRLRFGGRR